MEQIIIRSWGLIDSQGISLSLEWNLLNNNTVNSLLATTSRKRPTPVNDRFVNNRLTSQSIC